MEAVKSSTIKLLSGARMPKIGLGTALLSYLDGDPEQVEEEYYKQIKRCIIEGGYRHLDTA